MNLAEYLDLVVKAVEAKGKAGTKTSGGGRRLTEVVLEVGLDSKGEVIGGGTQSDNKVKLTFQV